MYVPLSHSYYPPTLLQKGLAYRSMFVCHLTEHTCTASQSSVVNMLQSEKKWMKELLAAYETARK
jgi:hypothetical protein